MVKKHLSVFLLMARGTVCPILGLLALTAAAEGGLFGLTLSRGAVEGAFSLELVVRNSRMIWVFGAGFLLLTALLSGMCRQVSGSYTALRLSVSGRWVFFWQSVYNVLCYLLFWAVQILIAIALGSLYARCAPAEFVSGQTVFLAFYRSKFLHSLLPFEDVLFWVRNGLMALSLGVCAARRPGRTDRGTWTQIVLTAVVLTSFSREIGAALGGLAAVAIAAGFAFYYSCFDRKEEEAIP